MAHAKSMLVLALVCGLLAARGAAAQTVLFDNSHGERFLIGGNGPLQLSGLAETFESAGAKVATLDKPISDASLAGADGLVISGAFASLKPEEIEAVVHFMQRGGKLAVMLHIAPPLAPLLDRLKIDYTNGVIQERDNIIDKDPQKFRVTRLRSHPVLEGLTEFSLYGVWGLINLDGSARTIAATGTSSWIDLNRDKIQQGGETSSFGVVVAGEIGKGGFLVFGDDAIFQNKFLDKNNKTLAVNLAHWLK